MLPEVAVHRLPQREMESYFKYYNGRQMRECRRISTQRTYRTYIQTGVSRKWVKYQFEWAIPLTKVKPTACVWAHWSGAHVLFVYNRLCLCVCSSIGVLLVPKEGIGRRGRRWEEEEEEEEEGKEQRQSGIIVTDRAAPWWAMRCIVCHLTNLNQSIISPSSTSAINQAGAAPAEGPAAPCCLFQVTQANQDS